MASGFSLTGGDRVIATYAQRLHQRGHDVLVISPRRAKPSLKRQFQSLLTGNGWIVASSQRGKSSLKERLRSLLTEIDWFKRPQHEPSHFDNLDATCRLLDYFRPVTDADVPDADIVIATWWETAEWVSKLSATKGEKVHFIQHYEAFDYLPKERVEATWKLPFHKIVISKWLLELAQKCFGDSLASHVPNSVDTDLFYAPPRNKQPLPTVGMLYSTAYWKGCDISLKALELVAQQLPNLQLVSFGEVSSTNTNFPPNTTYFQHPEQDKIKDVYAKCDVWLCGSRSEGFHLPPLEAMACRCPVVSTQVGGPLDIVENGSNGYLVPIEDPVALAEKLVQVLTLANEQWQAMSDAAYATAIKYTWDNATDRFETALQLACKQSWRGDAAKQDSLGVTTP